MVRTRIAPSPTGEDLHIGNLHAALLNWAWAKKHGGQFIVRIEDTDRLRYVEGAEEKILKTLKEFGLNYDEEPYKQSNRLDLYKKYLEQLIENGAAYHCFCSKERLDEIRKAQQEKKLIPKYDKHCSKSKREPKDGEVYVVRLNVPADQEIVFEDVIRGEIKFNSNDIDDQVLLKSDGYPTYHLAVVVDDHLMNISHVIRGEDWISSTPKHVLLYKAFGWPLPVYCHTPLLRNPDKSKLSKRKNPVWASWYLEQGYLPQAVLNYLALMGWSHPDQKEIFSMEEFIKVFDLKDMQAVGPVFDINKLKWMNFQYSLKLPLIEYSSMISGASIYHPSSNDLKPIIPLVRERIKVAKEYDDIAGFFYEKPKGYEVDLSSKKALLQKIHDELNSIKDWRANLIGEAMQRLAEKEGVKNSEFFMTLRVAIAGRKVTPPLNESMELLGKDECTSRIKSLI